MIRILFMVSCLTVALFFSFFSNNIKAQTGTATPQASATTNEQKNSDYTTMLGELASAISPSSPPGALIGTATAFDLFWVDVKAGTSSGDSITSSISWGGLLPSGATPTTCTLTLSSPPPGPVQVELVGPGVASGVVTMDSQNLVINKASFSAWFPVGLSTTYFFSAIFWINGQWFSLSKDITTEGGYPVLQWQPAALTITYQ